MCRWRQILSDTGESSVIMRSVRAMGVCRRHRKRKSQVRHACWPGRTKIQMSWNKNTKARIAAEDTNWSLRGFGCKPLISPLQSSGHKKPDCAVWPTWYELINIPATNIRPGRRTSSGHLQVPTTFRQRLVTWAQTFHSRRCACHTSMRRSGEISTPF